MENILILILIKSWHPSITTIVNAYKVVHWLTSLIGWSWLWHLTGSGGMWYKKNVLILTCVVEYGSPGDKHNHWNELSYWGHVTRNDKYINHSDRSLQCNIVFFIQSLLNLVLNIVWEWKHYKGSAKITSWMKLYKRSVDKLDEQAIQWSWVHTGCPYISALVKLSSTNNCSELFVF